MSSKVDIEKNPVLKDEDLKNAELCSAENMAQDKIIQDAKGEISDEGKDPVFVPASSKARCLNSEILNMKVEFIMFLFMFSYILRTITATQMVMEKVCVVHLENPVNVCRNLTGYPDVKSAVEKMANNYGVGHSLIQLMPAALLSLFIGTWSDKYSRKIPVIVGLIGVILDGFGTIACAYFMYSRVEYYLIPAIFSGISGGIIGVLLVLYSYGSDITSPHNRTMKYALMELAFAISMPLGNLAGGWLYFFFGYIPVFLTSTCGHIIGLFWVIFVLEETKGLDNDDSWMVKWRVFWSLDSVVRSYRTTLKRRPNKGRGQILLIILSMSLGTFSLAATGGVTFYFVHHQYNWENTIYSTVSAIFSVLSMISMLIVVPISRKLHIGDPYLGLVGSVSLLLKNIGIGLASKKTIFFIANALGLLSNLGSLAGRSRISKIVSKEDLGKVFAFLTTAESLLPIVAIAVVSQAFNATLDFFPGLIFIVMGVLILISVAVFIWLISLPAANYEEISESPEKKTDCHVQEKTLPMPSEEKHEKI